MRKFIVSDLHGNLNIYKSIMNYLENVNKNDELILYINGDLIDRGLYSADMLLDVRKRIKAKEGFKIKYLGGNHELMMYQASLKRKDNNQWATLSSWFFNGGQITQYRLEELVDLKEELEVIKFISNLDIYKVFKEKIDDKQIVLVHAKCPNNPKNKCDLKIKDNNYQVDKYVWTREEDLRPILKESLGNKNYFTIIGHTSVSEKEGYKYYNEYNCINIDGGCAAYALGYLDFNHTPLVEIDEKNNRLIILTFNNNNEIIYGNYFIDKKSIQMDNNELNKRKKYINNDINIKF